MLSRLFTTALTLAMVPVLQLPAQGPAAAPGLVGVSPASGSSAMRGPRDPVEVEAFMDGLMAAYMRDKHIAGVTVSVVRDGALLFAKGYGYADVAKRTPVDPATTLFRIGSVTKLFTWTAVMQLHEQGKLDLAQDVNAYLDFAIPATFPQPITLRDILTHTPGLEEDSRDLFTEDSTHITPMSTWLPAHMPQRVRPPATFSSYSNWATATAGYIVERVGGAPTWDDYLERHIFEPLGMTQSTGRQPLPARLAPDASIGYAWKDGEFVPKKFEIVTGAAPAGSISASATDMAKFMIAHLNGGASGDARILGEKEAALMHTRIQGHDSRIPGFAHGFYEQTSHGVRIIGHGGDTQYFHTNLSLIPSERVGVFMSTNTDQGATISFQPFLTAFLDHYYPVDVPVITPGDASKQGAKRYAGEYVFNRRNVSTYQKAAGLVGTIPVAAMPDGSLLAQTPFGAMRLVAVDSLLWRDVNSDALVAFRADADGRITHGFLAATPMMAMERTTGLAAPGLHRAILIAGLLMFLAVVVTAVVRFFLRTVPGRPAVPRAVTGGRRAMAWAGVCVLAFVGAIAALASNPVALLSDAPTGLKLALALPVLGVALVLWALWYGGVQWRTGAGTIWMRLRHSGAILVALVFFWSLQSWNLLGWHF